MKGFAIVLSLLFVAISVDGQQVVKVMQKSNNGNSMLFLPHIGCTSEMWSEIASYYQKSHSVYLVDFAGFGGLKPIDTLFTESYVNAVSKFIRANKLKNVVLVGQNYGAFVAIQVAQRIDVKIQAVIASDFYPKLSMVLAPNMTSEQLQQLKSGVRQGIMHSNDSAFMAMQKQSAEMMNFTKQEDVNRFLQWQVASDRKTLAETLCEQFEGDLLSILKDNHIPMLVLSTWYFAKTYHKTPVSEAHKKLKEMYGETANVTHAVTEDAKDFMANDQPEWFIAQMNTFLKTVPVGK